ncbi:hypothetical protein ACYG9R_15420 [Mesorhizobium sp. RSR565B]|uniref:hypothetical protein n=1 Tax=unclassified Mesorhizobium TaxID=325217 RepID=UPI0003D06767|nr:hypothetical protein [Mesorhizobium sp. L103C565B0]ESZ45532.1 hypothetical protein X730_21645 [Mesorhizobium sp. L103C565B0]
MSGFRFASLVLAVSSIVALPSLAAAQSSDYVYCSNGIVCMMAPCPSGNALDLTTGNVVKGVELNTTELPPLDRSAPDLSDKLYAGKLVVRGSIQHRGQPNDPPMLVVTKIERSSSKKSERKRCAAR